VINELERNWTWSWSNTGYCSVVRLERPGGYFRGCVPKLSINFEEILSRAHGNFEDQYKVLEPSIIIVNYCIDTNNNNIII
jgi:hypothetical protein